MPMMIPKLKEDMLKKIDNAILLAIDELQIFLLCVLNHA